ncbi:hypothetical protein SAMN05216466_103273 [Paraburkholderia phenazinium]|uniref:Uncharacterized protein n=2 Tax=Paraburkholderia phenazinium TaxID=60549 RepID=A0A1G7U4Y8_9BURK|nr:hypothetical protein SAMN05216466_103273 [Paraburkholderia phenazinium]
MEQRSPRSPGKEESHFRKRPPSRPACRTRQGQKADPIPPKRPTSPARAKPTAGTHRRKPGAKTETQHYNNTPTPSRSGPRTPTGGATPNRDNRPARHRPTKPQQKHSPTRRNQRKATQRKIRRPSANPTRRRRGEKPGPDKHCRRDLVRKLAPGRAKTHPTPETRSANWNRLRGAVPQPAAPATESEANRGRDNTGPISGRKPTRDESPERTTHSAAPKRHAQSKRSAQRHRKAPQPTPGQPEAAQREMTTSTTPNTATGMASNANKPRHPAKHKTPQTGRQTHDRTADTGPRNTGTDSTRTSKGTATRTEPRQHQKNSNPRSRTPTDRNMDEKTSTHPHQPPPSKHPTTPANRAPSDAKALINREKSPKTTPNSFHATQTKESTPNTARRQPKAGTAKDN